LRSPLRKGGLALSDEICSSWTGLHLVRRSTSSNRPPLRLRVTLRRALAPVVVAVGKSEVRQRRQAQRPPSRRRTLRVSQKGIGLTWRPLASLLCCCCRQLLSIYVGHYKWRWVAVYIQIVIEHVSSKTLWVAEWRDTSIRISRAKVCIVALITRVLLDMQYTRTQISAILFLSFAQSASSSRYAIT